MKSTDYTDLEARFLAMTEKYGGRFRRVARAYANHGEADDLLQEIWLQIWRSLDRFEGASRLDTWAFRIALNTAISYRRKAKPVSEEFDESHVGSTRPTLEGTSHLLEDFLSNLKPADRAVLLLHLDDRSAEEMMDILGMSANAVAIRMSRIRKLYECRYLED